MSLATSRSLALVLALALLAACKPAPLAPNAQEGTISTERGGAKLGVGGRAFTLRTLDGKALDTVDLQVGSQVFHATNGKLSLPEAAMAAIRDRGAFLLRAPGYVPRKVALDATGDVQLVPIGPALAQGSASPAGGQLGAGAVGLGLPAGMLARPAAVAVNGYQVPASDLDAAGMGRERAAVVAAANLPDGGCDRPLPCPPPAYAIGLLVNVDGPVQAGTLEVTYDLTQLAAAGFGPAVDRLRATFTAIDVTGDASLVWRRALQERYGIVEQGDRLTFPVKVGDNAFNDGVARIEVDGLGVLGVRLEVTLVSQAPAGQAATPPGAPPAQVAHVPGNLQLLGNFGNLITNDGGGLINNGGSTILAQGAGNLITNDGASLIGNDGASLISQDGGSFVDRFNGLVAAASGKVLTDNGNLLLAGAGGSLIGNDGASLVSLNAGGAITGFVVDPVAAPAQTVDTGKYTLLAGFAPPGVGASPVPVPRGGGGSGGGAAVPQASQPAVTALGAPVLALDGVGTAVGPGAYTDASGRYRLDHLLSSWNGLVVEARVGGHVLHTLAPAPGNRTVEANLTAATSGVAAVAIDAQAGNTTLAISRSAFQADVSTLDGLMSSADATYMVTNPIPAAAARVRAIFAGAGKAMQLGLPAGGPTPPPSPVAPPTGLGTGTTGPAGSELQIHGLNLPANAAGLRVVIANMPAAFSRMAGATDWFVWVPLGAPVGPTTLEVFFNDGVNPESSVLRTAFDVTAAAAGNPTLAVGTANPSRGQTVTFLGSNLPPMAQLGVQIGGVAQPTNTVTPGTLTFTIDTSTPTGTQPIVVTWYDPTRGPQVILSDVVMVQ